MTKISEITNNHNKNSEQDILHEVEPTKSQENIKNKFNEREEDVTVQNQEIYPEKNITQSSKEKHANHDTRTNDSKSLGSKNSVVILGDSMTKLLSGWKMAKRIQSNCKIYVKTFSGATVSCRGDYMKPSLRNPTDIYT